jgi:hypothetical protein
MVCLGDLPGISFPQLHWLWDSHISLAVEVSWFFLVM